jgi:hypothetical protein
MNTTLKRPWYLAGGEGYSFINTSVTPEQVLYSLIRARVARSRAESYRGFSVGVCGVILREDGMERILQHGANIKDGPGVSEIDKHGEDYVVEALKSGDVLASLAIVAPVQEDSDSGIEAPTLHPCFKCRDKIEAAGEATAKSLIVCSTPDITAVQWGNIADYQRFHAGHPDGLGTALFDETPEMFHPLTHPPNKPIDLRDSRFEVDTREWDMRVTTPILEWLIEHQYQ